MNSDKKIFIEKTQSRILNLVTNTIRLIEQRKYSLSVKIIGNQLIKCVTSIGANYRASCRARSKKEFYSKLCIVVEEADETLYWLNVIEELNWFPGNQTFSHLKRESLELLKIFASAKNSSFNN